MGVGMSRRAARRLVAWWFWECSRGFRQSRSLGDACGGLVDAVIVVGDEAGEADELCVLCVCDELYVCVYCVCLYGPL